MNKPQKIAEVKLDLKASAEYRDGLVAWLHEKAEEIQTMKDEEFVDKPKWSFYV